MTSRNKFSVLANLGEEDSPQVSVSTDRDRRDLVREGFEALKLANQGWSILTKVEIFAIEQWLSDCGYQYQVAELKKVAEDEIRSPIFAEAPLLATEIKFKSGGVSSKNPRNATSVTEILGEDTPVGAENESSKDGSASSGEDGSESGTEEAESEVDEEGNADKMGENEKNTKQGIGASPPSQVQIEGTFLPADLAQKVLGEMPHYCSEANEAPLPHQFSELCPNVSIGENSQTCSEGKSWANIVARDTYSKDNSVIPRLNIRSSSSNIEMVDLGTAWDSNILDIEGNLVDDQTWAAWLGWKKVTKRRTSTKTYDQNPLGDKTRQKAGGGQNNKNQPKASSQSKAKIENKEKVGVVKAGMIHTLSGEKNVSNVPTILPEKRAHFRGGVSGSKVENGDEKVCRLYGDNGDLSPQEIHFPALSSNLFPPTKGGAVHKGSKMKEGCG
ncbi:hypothetical protein U1Q18_009829 [Sarracenia purpurea var. burkii]